MSNPKIGGTSQFITLAEATELNRRYRNDKDKMLQPDIDPNVLPICETFNREYFDGVLAQGGCTGIRIYFGMKVNGDVCAVVVGVNAANEDMINGNSGTAKEENLIIENGERCPNACPPPSELNS